MPPLVLRRLPRAFFDYWQIPCPHEQNGTDFFHPGRSNGSMEHPMRLVGLTPWQFRMPARIAKKPASSDKNPGPEPSTLYSGSGRESPQIDRVARSSARRLPHFLPE
jgi:hypothetical protein